MTQLSCCPPCFSQAHVICVPCQGVHYLRNVADADALVAAIAECKAAGGKVCGRSCRVLAWLVLASSAGCWLGWCWQAVVHLVMTSSHFGLLALCWPLQWLSLLPLFPTHAPTLLQPSGGGHWRRVHRAGVRGCPGAQWPGRHHGEPVRRASYQQLCHCSRSIGVRAAHNHLVQSNASGLVLLTAVCRTFASPTPRCSLRTASWPACSPPRLPPSTSSSTRVGGQ